MWADLRLSILSRKSLEVWYIKIGHRSISISDCDPDFPFPTLFFELLKIFTFNSILFVALVLATFPFRGVAQWIDGFGGFPSCAV